LEERVPHLNPLGALKSLPLSSVAHASKGTGRGRLEEINMNRGILYDDRVVDVCNNLFSDKSYSMN
jgi:hypothetical protein